MPLVRFTTDRSKLGEQSEEASKEASKGNHQDSLGPSMRPHVRNWAENCSLILPIPRLVHYGNRDQRHHRKRNLGENVNVCATKTCCDGAEREAARWDGQLNDGHLHHIRVPYSV